MDGDGDAVEFGLLNSEGCAANDAAEFDDDGLTEAQPEHSRRRRSFCRLATLRAAGALVGSAAFAAVAAAAMTGRLRPGGTVTSPSMADLVVEEAVSSCHTARAGEGCFDKVKWASTEGISKDAKLYPGLTLESTFEDFQAYFHKAQYGGCQQPCAPGAPTPAPPAAAEGDCLCLFDVDRTLTTKQGNAGQCQGSQAHGGIFDPAFGGGDLVLSPLGLGLTSATFCGQCHLGIVSQGGAGGPEMKQALEQHLPGAGTDWSGPNPVTSPLIIGCADAMKAQCAKGIVDWYRTSKGINIPSGEVYFFDDHDGNTNGFGAMGFNARQISCGSRDGPYGFCGGQPGEVVRAKGVQNCR